MILDLKLINMDCNSSRHKAQYYWLSAASTSMEIIIGRSKYVPFLIITIIIDVVTAQARHFRCGAARLSFDIFASDRNVASIGRSYVDVVHYNVSGLISAHFLVTIENNPLLITAVPLISRYVTSLTCTADDCLIIQK